MSVAHYWPITEDDVYVRVFNLILSELDHTLLDAELVRSYLSLSVESRYLVTRMYIRTPKWIRIDELERYMSLNTLETKVIPELKKNNWIKSDPEVHSVINDIATSSELQLVCRNLGINYKLKGKVFPRNAIVEQLLQLEQQQTFFKSSKLSEQVKTHVQTNSFLLNPFKREFLASLELLFLYPAGPDAKLDLVYLCNMKKCAFYTYKYYTQAEKPIFASKEACILYCEAYKLHEPVLAASRSSSAANIDISLISPEKVSLFESRAELAFSSKEYTQAAYIYGRFWFDLSQIYMKLHRFSDEYACILKYLSQNTHKSKRGVVFIRKLLLEVRFLEQTNTKGESSWLISAVNTYYDASLETNAVQKLDLNKKTVKLVSSIRNTGLKSALSFIPKVEVFSLKIPQKTVIAEPGAPRKLRVQYDGLNVEQLALKEYEPLVGGHYEGSLLLTVFWLLTYDLLFKDADYFRCAYQSGPMHLQKAINNNTAEFETRFADPVPVLKRNHTELANLEPKPAIGAINWSINELTITNFVSGLGDQLKPLLMRLSTDYRTFSSGFPDLTLYDPATKRVKFVEVKSENDVVSDNQQLWLEFLVSAGCDAEVCKVVSPGKARKRRKDT